MVVARVSGHGHIYADDDGALRQHRAWITRNGLWLGDWCLTWRDPFTHRLGLALDNGVHVIFLVGLRER